MVARKTIVLKGHQFGIRVERKAAAAITPGDLIQYTSTDLFQRAGVAAVAYPPIFAVENEVFGKGIEVDYGVNDQVLAEACHSGMEVYACLAAAAVAIVVGDFLTPAADGTLRKVVTTDYRIAVALEAVDNSAGGGKVHIHCAIL